jgi:hypothetical protein
MSRKAARLFHRDRGFEEIAASQLRKQGRRHGPARRARIVAQEASRKSLSVSRLRAGRAARPGASFGGVSGGVIGGGVIGNDFCRRKSVSHPADGAACTRRAPRSSLPRTDRRGPRPCQISASVHPVAARSHLVASGPVSVAVTERPRGAPGPTTRARARLRGTSIPRPESPASSRVTRLVPSHPPRPESPA